MPESSVSVAQDLSGYRDAPPEEVARLLEKATEEPQSPSVAGIQALLMNRVLRLLRLGSREEILAEALMLNRFLAREGAWLKEGRPDLFAGWSVLGELLSGAARSTGRAAVPALLRGTQGKGLAILELLAAEGRALPRAEIRRRLDLAEAHLSHLLRDLEEADLIVRYRPEGGKEVLVDLGPAGLEVRLQSILPAWVERLAAALSTLGRGTPFNAEALVSELQEGGLPSRLAAKYLADAVAQFASTVAAVPPWEMFSEANQRGKALTGYCNGIEGDTGKYLFSPSLAVGYLDLLEKSRRSAGANK